ncbi:MFS general substrate transporter [Periconia macrospinosa]|uniref:MFS general substrate transporter n=1 Tax=Periconia macrospinosa TaxID=97972 RepID=A0A2V1DUJ3_9PLEO|nr:MFS general substrate transporter [Periconia macrospinosa]
MPLNNSKSVQPHDSIEPLEQMILDENIYTPPSPGWQEWVFIILLCSTQFFVQGALGYVLLPLGIVGKTFGQEGSHDVTRMNWHVAGYSLTFGTFILVTGKLGDIYGFKKVFLIGWVWFGVWSMVCGCSALTASAIFFDTSRALQGIGPALLVPSAQAIAGIAYPPGRKKNVVFSLMAMSAPLGCSTAGLIGSALAQYVWWPWVAWIYGIGCFVIAVAGYLVVPQDPRRTFRTNPKMDWQGAALAIMGLLLLNISWNLAPIDGWSTPHVYVLLVVGFVCLGLFVLQEKRAEEPILDLSLFNGRVAGVLVITGLGWSSFGIWFYYMFQFIQQLRGVSALGSAVQFIPGAISGMLAAIATTWLLEVAQTAWLMVIASTAFFAGCLLQAVAPIHQSYWFNTFWSFVVMAWGFVFSFL